MTEPASSVRPSMTPAHDVTPVPQTTGTRPSAWFLGVGFTFLIAMIGLLLANYTPLNRVGPLACAILISIAYRQVAGYPTWIKSGIQFSSKRLLRLAIILFGLKLNISIVLHQGFGLLLRDSLTIAFSILVTLGLATVFKAERLLSLLLGVGTGVCGAAAIAAVSPILKAKDEDTAIGVGIIALIGTVFALIYTLLQPFLPIPHMEYGIWCGVSLHEIAQVALAAAPAGQSALTVALLAKLGRVFLLVPLCFILVLWMRKKQGKTEQSIVEFPWFLIGFLVMSVLGSYVLGHVIPIPSSVMGDVSTVTTFLLTMAMVGLGLNVSFRDLRSKALRPLLAMVVTSVLLSGLTYLSL